ncbi:MAG: hypothetical protein L6427_10535 [Actinomycetia bacterium]|nr:hypothetical protein [Actinomycetes bacterium]
MKSQTAVAMNRATRNAVVKTGRSGPTGSHTIVCDREVPGLENVSLSTVVTSDEEIIAERAMYFDCQGQRDGHAAGGLNSAAESFLFAEEYTADGFDTFLLLQNPNSKSINVNVNYTVDPAYGGPHANTHNVPANIRRTVRVDDGLAKAAFGMTLSADGEFTAERAMYFDYGTSSNGNRIAGGHDACGASGAATAWWFAEGYTGW